MGRFKSIYCEINLALQLAVTIHRTNTNTLPWAIGETQSTGLEAGTAS